MDVCFVYLSMCVCVYLQIQGPWRKCCSIRPGTSGLLYYCAQLVCVPDVIGLLAVWRHNKPKTQKKNWKHVPAPSGVARCLHTCDPMFKGLYFSNHPCLRFLWMHTYHVHIKIKIKFDILCVPTPPICALLNHVLLRIYSMHLNTCSRVDVYAMQSNKIRIPWIHNEIYSKNININ